MAKRSQAMSTKVRKYLAKHPLAKAQAVADATGATVQYVHNIRYADKKNGVVSTPAVKKPKWKLLGVSTSKEAIRLKERLVELKVEAQEDIIATHHTDMVNEPPHYKMGGIETIDFIEAKQFGYNLGNVVKYISRADLKGSHYEDLLKARWYLNREIAKFSPDTKVAK
jgi:homoserine dehydrogenase